MRIECLKAALGLGLVFAGAGGLAQIPCDRTVGEANDPVERPRRAGKTYFFAERQLYTPAMNFQHRYIDRPLFTDSTLRKKPGGAMKAGFYRDMEILRWSGFDGFGSIAYSGVYHEQLGWLKKDPPPDGYSQFPVLWNFYRKPDRADPHYATLKKMIQAAAKSPYAARLDGRPLVWLWGNALDKQCDWLKLLKSDPEIPPFACFPIAPFYPMYGSFNSSKHPGVCTPEACERYKRELAEMLSWADGVQLWLCERYLTWNGDHGRHILKTDLCRKYLFPLTLEVMSRPEFKDKYLGAFIEQAYINHKNGPVSDQYGTEMLRTFLDEAMLQNPDILVAFEWNEANENTSFQPTVTSAGAVARVIGYYRSKINREQLKPRPGDDVSVPNLVLSTRQTMRVGEAYHAELLYVPDGTAPAPFQARVVLRDATGRKLRELPWEKLPTAKLTAFSYRLPGEDFASELAVTPEIEVKTGEDVRVYRGFDSTRFEPAVCINYLYCRQPLREIIAPAEESFSVKPLGGGRYAVKGSFASGEELSSLEVMENTHEVASAENGELFNRERDHNFVVSFMAIRSFGNREVLVEIPGVDGWKLRRAEVPYDPVRVADEGNPRKVKLNITAKRTMLLSVPKDACRKAKVRISVSKMDVVKEVSLADVLERGVYASTWPGNLRLEVERMDKLGDYPAPLGTRSAETEVVLDAISLNPVYQLRAISKSGRVWRSRPIVPVRPSGAKRRVECYSCCRRKWVDAEMDSARIVDVKYDFADSSRGDFLVAVGGDRRWDVSLGGGWDSEGPMWWEFIKSGPKLTKDFTNSVPDRVIAEDGSPALRFDGRGQYLAFPQELIPCDSGYKLGFEIRPDAEESYVLIRQMHSVNEECGLRLVTDKGELVISFFGRSLVPRHFRTGLKLRPGEWNRVVIEKTGRTLSCSLDGVKKTYPYDRLALHFKTAIFGANIMPGRELPEGIKPFKGLMRALHVRHAIDADAAKNVTKGMR